MPSKVSGEHALALSNKMYRDRTPVCPWQLSNRTADLGDVSPRQVAGTVACPFCHRKVTINSALRQDVIANLAVEDLVVGPRVVP